MRVFLKGAPHSPHLIGENREEGVETIKIEEKLPECLF
jgi:hypothetical protein